MRWRLVILTTEENELLTRTGPGTPSGEFLRRYWQPVAAADEIPPGGAPIPLRILGEELVLFRDQVGRPGLLGLHCSHRRADLSYGRIEDGGLRCVYHGWLYDVNGHCLDQPGEPEGSRFKEKISHPAYPCQEKGGIVFAYFGGDTPPQLPDYLPLLVPPEYRLIVKVRQECNYLQGYEGNFDPVHLSFLHRFLNSGDDAEAPRNVLIRGSHLSKTQFDNRFTTATIEMEETDFGMRVCLLMPAEPGKTYVRFANFVYPNAAIVAGSPKDFRIMWHVPIDDHHHWRWDVFCQFTEPISDSQRALYRRDLLPDGTPERNRSNRYLQDPNTRTMGPNFTIHDTFATEGQGAVQDRTSEHLGYTDRAITALRRLLLRAVRSVQEGSNPPHRLLDSDDPDMTHIVSSVEVVPIDEWRDAWKIRSAEMREFLDAVQR